MTARLVSADSDTGRLPDVVLFNLDARFPKGSNAALPPALSSGLSVDESAQPKAIEFFGGKVWGTGSGVISSSTDNGSTWTTYTATPDGDSVRRLIPTVDGEVVCATGNGLFKSNGWSAGSPTWTKKITTNASAQFFPFNVAGNGQKFIATQYSASVRPDSRYGHISLDGGTTWTQVWDSVGLFGQTAADASHVHGCEYDDRSGRFYISEGHGDIAGIYYSADNGQTWVRPSGLIQNPSPTVMVATDDGLVCGSDHTQAGVYGVVRQSDPGRETLKRTYAWRTGRSGVVGFGVRGWRDPSTGLVYIGFRSEFTDVAPIIAGGSATSAALVFEWPTLPVTISDSFGAVVLPDAKNLISSATVNGVSYTVRGKVASPSVATDDPGGLLGGSAPDGRSLAAGSKATTGTSASSVALGAGAIVSATQQGTALGAGATVTGTSGVAVGDAAASGGTGVAVGSGATTNAFGAAVVVGSGASVTGGGQGTVVGSGATSVAQSTVLGYLARANGANSASVGLSATTSNDGVAVGAGSNAGGSQTAVGRSATAAHAGSTALGKDTATTGVNQTAIGARSVNLKNVPAAPATISDSGSLYVEGGALKFKGSNGTVTTIATA